MTALSRKPRTDRFSRLDIIEDHELSTMTRNGFLIGRCSCGSFEHSWNNDGRLAVMERLKDHWLKHVQQTRDSLRLERS